jgi:hypothetical protein
VIRASVLSLNDAEMARHVKGCDAVALHELRGGARDLGVLRRGGGAEE